MESPFNIRYPDKFVGNLKIQNDWPPACKYKIPFATPIYSICDLGSFLLQYVNGDDYCLELCSFVVTTNGYIDLIVSRPVIFLALFLKGEFAGDLLGNGFVSIASKTFNLFYLPAGTQRVSLRKGEYAVLFVVPPDYYFKSMADEHKGINNLLSDLLSARDTGSASKGFALPHAAMRIIKRLEKTNKKGAALDIELRKNILEILGLYNEQIKRESEQPNTYNTTKEKANAARKYILENLGDTNLGGLNEIALRLHVTAKPLTREFKALTGKTIPKFITAERLNLAKQLLAKHEMRVFEVTLLVGFSDTANFIRKFKKKFGYSPGSRDSRQ